MNMLKQDIETAKSSPESTGPSKSKRTLKVAFLTTRLDFNDGVASHIELLASHMVRGGTELTMITGLTSGEDVAQDRCAMLRSLFPRWYEIQPTQLRPTLSVVRKLRWILRRGTFDLVHVHGVRALLLARLATLSTGLPLIVTYHPSAHGVRASDFKLEVSWKQKLAYRLFLEALRPSSLIALSSDTYDLFVRQTGWSTNRIRRIICGVNTSHFRVPTPEERAAARSTFSFDRDTLTFVLPGRLNLNKGHDLVIAALNGLRAENPSVNIKCLFPGAGAQAKEIRALIRASPDPDMFTMLGFVPDMRDVYWAADAVLLPSRNEGFAIVIAEAMACGCPAIRTPSGGCSDQIVEGETGYTVRFNNAEDIAASIRAIRSRSVLEHMRETAASYALEKFSADRMVEETMQLYRDYAGCG